MSGTRLQVAVLTPPGRGAVATVRVAGQGAAKLVGQCFVAADGRQLAGFPLGRVFYGRWGSATGEEVVVCGRPVAWPSLSETRAPVPERRGQVDAIEIHCHGGSAAARAIVQSLEERGAEVVGTGEFASADIDHLQVPGDAWRAPSIAAEARAALAAATTLRTASILLDQWAGALSDEAEQVVQLLSSDQVADAMRRLETVLRRCSVGLHLTAPWRVVLAGRPNVGKSSLINALVGYQRAIVFDQPGTTRDVVTAAAALGGWPVELTDTAGLRPSAAGSAAHDALEAAGMAKAREQIAAADLIVLVFDAAAPWSEEDEALVHRHPHSLGVLNKCDLATGAGIGSTPLTPALSPKDSGGHIAGSAMPVLRTSAITGEGIQALGRHIAARLVPDVPPPGAAVPFSLRQVELLTAALDAVRRQSIAAARETLTTLANE